MKYTHLGRTGLKISRFGLGTISFGSQTSEADSFAIMDHALEHGINFVDTANSYGGQKDVGGTEQIIGRWLAQGGGRRDNIVLATKVYNVMGTRPNESGLSALHIRRACEDSLRRLQTDHIDLYQMHHIDRETPWEEIWQAMEQLIREGKVIYIGSSNFAGWHIARANEIARSRHLLGLVSEQSIYNLNTRTIELEVLPACEAYGLGVLPWSPLAGGLLASAVSKAETGRRANPNIQAAIEENRAQLTAYENFCTELGEEPARIALAWLLSNPIVTAPIIGPRTVSELNDCLRALDIHLSEVSLEQLDRIFPGPGGPAPDAYAW
jgi:aryl-alcohol dehydrogenase-like predicted oxidoreductase